MINGQAINNLGELDRIDNDTCIEKCYAPINDLNLTTFLLVLNSSSVLFFGFTNADRLLCMHPINLVRNDVTSFAVLNRILRFFALDVASNSTDAILQ